MSDVAALFVRADSVYKTMAGVDAWDIERDARSWPGGCPAVAHPPCRAWGRLRQFAQPREGERELGPWAVAQVRRWGGVIEHPAESTLFAHCRMPRPGQFPDDFGGWTLAVDQFIFGHRAEKATWLYVVGCDPDDIPHMPIRGGSPTHCIRPTKTYPRLPSVTKAEREHTPAPLAQWLVEPRSALRREPRNGGCMTDPDFKNFHRLLCERFGYTHDDANWKRDQLSLIEHIAQQIPNTFRYAAVDDTPLAKECADMAELFIALRDHTGGNWTTTYSDVADLFQRSAVALVRQKGAAA